MAFTIKDIAKLAGVSHPVVSRALRGQPGVAKKTVERIKKIADELGYEPNVAAQSLKTGSSHTIGIIVPDISIPYYASICSYVERKALEKNYYLIMCSSIRDPLLEDKLIQTLLNRQISGLIIASRSPHSNKISSLKNKGVPFVLLDIYMKHIKSSYVVSDNEKGSQELTEYLIGKGHEKIAYFSRLGEEITSIKERELGYEKALNKHGIPKDRNLIRTIDLNNLEETIRENLEDIITNKLATAIYSGDSGITMRIYKYLEEMKVKIPDEIALVSFDNIHVFELLNPPITAMAQNEEQLGYETARILLDHLEDKDASIECVKIPTLLIERHSA